MLSYGVCVSVCLSCSWVVSKWINISSKFFHHRVANTILVFPCQTAWQYSDRDVECRWGSQKSRFWAHLALVLAVSAATFQVLSTRSPVDDGHRLASYDTLLVVSGGVDCGRRRRNVYDKKPQRYAKDNRTAHLTARSDKPVAYVTNNKRLYSMFCTVEANYWQIRSIARPLCNSRATCYLRQQGGGYVIGLSVCVCVVLWTVSVKVTSEFHWNLVLWLGPAIGRTG